MTRGIFPGSFNPPTHAHLAIALAAIEHAGLDRLDFSLSRVTLGKEAVQRPTIEERAEVMRAVCRRDDRLGVRVTDARLIVDVARGYDALVVGADKWAQVIDPAWYQGSSSLRDAALAQLPPTVLVVPRAGDRPTGVELLEIRDDHAHVSSTDARRDDALMLDEAQASALWRAAPSPVE